MNEGLKGGKNKKVVRFSVSASPDLFEEFDEVVRSLGSNRSRAVQMALRNFIRDFRLSSVGENFAVGSINVVYDHGVRGLDEWLTELQHGHMGVIVSSMHVHLTKEKCLLIIVVRGNLTVIQDLIKQLIGRRGIDQVKFAAVLS